LRYGRANLERAMTAEQTPTHHRELTIDWTRRNDTARTAPCTLSTEHPVWRGTFNEVLSHADGAVDLSRAPLPLIASHDSSMLPIGVVDAVRVGDRKLSGIVRFGNSTKAREIWMDVQSGIIRALSIGYQWLDYSEVDNNTLLVTRWQPYECSAVAIPADPNAGFYRGKNMTTETQTNNESETPMLDKLSRRQKRDNRAAIEEERHRVIMIQQACRHFKLDDFPEGIQLRNELINSGTPLEMAQAIIRQNMPESEPISGVASSAPRTDDEPRIYPVSSNNPVIAHFGRSRPEAERNAYNVGNWLRGVLMGDKRAFKIAQNRGMSTMSPSGGSALVPAELSSAIISLTEEYGVARRAARVWPMGSDTLQIPRRTEGPTAYYIGEGSEITESTPSLSGVQLVARKLAARVIVSTELAEDAVIDLAGYLAEEIAREFAKQEDLALFLGDGTSTYGGIVGVIPALKAGVGAVDATAGHDTLAEITDADLRGAMSKLPGYARDNARWYAHWETIDMVFSRLAAAFGGTTMEEVGNKRLTSYHGRPIIPTAVMPNGSDVVDGSVPIIFGDLRQAAAFGDRRSITVRVDDTSRMAYDQLVVQATERYDVVVHDAGDSTNYGSVVGLAMNTA
jgi:HK97 family phage major capsid protein/HK97 family phage prohead protease